MKNQKHTLKRVVACAIVVFVAITATIMSGVVGIELPEWSEVFVAKASAISEGYYTYSVSNGKATITDVDNSISGNVTIPSKLGGYPVTEIDGRAFYKCTDLTSITIPNNVTSIGDFTFIGCTGLTRVTIPDSVTSIGMEAFEDCIGLTGIEISDLASWCEIIFVSNPLYYAKNLYINGELATDIRIPDSVTRIGSRTFEGCTCLTSVTIPDSVTSIGYFAFSGCTGLTSVTIPDSVSSIGDSAFRGCTGLTNITIPGSVTSIGEHAFGDCTGLLKLNWNATKVGDLYYFNPDPDSMDQYRYWDVFSNAGTAGDGIDVVFGDTVEEIPDYLFLSSAKIKTVTIGNSVTSIGNSAFSGCTDLISVYITDLAAWCEIVFYSNPLSYAKNLYINGELATDIKIPDGVTRIGSSAFKGCTCLTNVTIPDSVTEIGWYTFRGCTGLTNATIPDSVTEIGWYAFEDCTGLTSVTIPDSVTSIGDEAFSGCIGLTSITIPDSIISIGSNAFNNTAWYNALPSGDVYIGKAYYAYKGKMPENTHVIIKEGTKVVTRSAFERCTGLTGITIPDSVTSIGTYAFARCTGLKSITIPDSVTSIGVCAFERCTGLRSITLSNSVTSIGSSAFEYCTGLKSITIPDSVTSIGGYAFEYCTGLKSITIPDSVTSIGSYVFEGCTGLKSVTIGSGIKSIDGTIFAQCRYIENLKVSGGVEKIEGGIFDNTPWYENHPYGDVYIGSVYYKYKGTVPTNTNITIKKGTKGIADKAFKNASGINTLTIPSSVTNIGKEVFAYKNYIGWKGFSIKTLIIEDLTAWCKIDFDGFYANPMKGAETITVNGNTISTLTVPSGITEIKDYAFCNFNTIDEVVIPKSVKRIGTYAFYNCENLSRVTVPGSVKTIGDGAFKLCDELSYAALENGIETIGEGAFYETAIRYLIIPDSVKSIGTEAFTHCYKLTDLTVGNGITAIGANAFKESSNLARIRIGKNVKSIGANAFSKLTNIPTVYYASSKTAWNNISIDKSNEFLLRATMHYNADISHKHNYAENITKNATCTKSGSKTLTCECGKTGTQSIPAKGHTAVTDKAVAPTCTKSGKTEGSHCKVCGTVFTAQKTIAATGHSYKTTKKLATVSTDGKTVTTCTVCGYVYRATTYYRASSIRLSASVFTYNGKVQRPSVTVKTSKGATLKNGTDYTVSYSSGCKNTGRYAVKVTFKGNYTGSKTLYFYILPGKTSSLTVAQSTTAVKATWKAVAGASGYIVTLYNSNNKVIKTVDTTKTTYTFSKLSAGTVYKVRVTAYKTIDSKKINSRSYTLLTTATKPGTPTLKVAAGTGKATLSWNKQTGATGYVVYMATSKNGKYTKIATVKGNSKVSFTKTGLTKGKTYYFKVAAYETVGGKTIYGSFSSVKYAKIK